MLYLVVFHWPLVLYFFGTGAFVTTVCPALKLWHVRTTTDYDRLIDSTCDSCTQITPGIAWREGQIKGVQVVTVRAGDIVGGRLDDGQPAQCLRRDAMHEARLKVCRRG